jgi:hypothetical protein
MILDVLTWVLLVFFVGFIAGFGLLASTVVTDKIRDIYESWRL